jgi:phosphatidylglycerophosphatase A
VIKRVIEALATGLYLGKIPFAPGTWGTLLGIPVVWLLSQMGSDIAYMVGVGVLIVVSSVIAEIYERQTGGHDPGEVVIDEIVGYAVAMTMLPQTWQYYLAAFVVFRIFDIWKPGLIRRVDQRVEGGLGTILDDVVAGLVANVVLQLVHQLGPEVMYRLRPWLGASFAS